MVRIWGFWLALVGGVALAVLGTTPPVARGVAEASDAFSVVRAMEDVRVIARAPHPSGSPELARLRGYLEVRLRAMGLQVREQRGEFPVAVRERLNRRSGEAAREIPLVNLVARLPGTDRSQPALLLMAHYDSVYGSPGAADDGAGVAAILETVRHLSAMKDRRRDVFVLFTDGEEADLSGARLFFGEAPEADRIGAVINLEARGGGGRANLFQTSPGNGEVARFWAEHAPSPAGTSMATFIYGLLPNDTDLTVALPRGYAAWNFAFIGRPSLYHSPLASADALDRGALRQMGDQTLGLARALVQSERLPGPSADRVFFDVFGLFVLDYAPAWGWPMLILGLGGFAVGLVGRWDARAFGAGAARMLALIAGVGLLLTVLNAISGRSGGDDYYDRLAAIPLLQAMAVLACLGVAVPLLARRPDSASGEAGLALPVLLMAVAGQALAPVAVYFVVIAVMLSGLGFAAGGRLPAGPVIAFQTISAALVGGYALVIGFALYQAVGPGLPSIAILPLALIALVFVPLRPTGALKSRVPKVALVGLAGAFALALWVRLDPLASSIPVYSEARSALKSL
ncbi:M20/M25/M40 family metallo-hydrolase [Novosphingobium profundi]|uniref:M20/M25/M40 family metallo-hydrolase n=1 Tax=Novosphingobium profundi TaxID=1774954 RepID=UPI001BD9395C|nr:M20/M25/M40 family metallo-hydrolase [Novosphingobium profundi]MBT0669054.1 M20/M25/M40 family metallo-hydrolase [Novosphingobium profundi]